MMMNIKLTPDYWGPVFWEAMYIASAGYSTTPTENEKIGFKMFFDSLRYVLPCAVCRGHYDKYIGENPITDQDSSSRDSLFEWVHRTHCHVSHNLKKNPPSLEVSRKNYYPLAIMPAAKTSTTSIISMQQPFHSGIIQQPFQNKFLNSNKNNLNNSLKRITITPVNPPKFETPAISAYEKKRMLMAIMYPVPVNTTPLDATTPGPGTRSALNNGRVLIQSLSRAAQAGFSNNSTQTAWSQKQALMAKLNGTDANGTNNQQNIQLVFGRTGTTTTTTTTMMTTPKVSILRPMGSGVPNSRNGIVVPRVGCGCSKQRAKK